MGPRKYRDKLDWLKIWIDFKSGDKDSFEIIYNEFVDRLYSYGSKITNDHDLVKDSIQDLFIDVYNYSIDLKFPEYLEFYLIKSLNRIIIGKLKSRNNIDYLSSGYPKKFNLKFDFEEEYIQDETDRIREKSIQNVLMELDPQKRELLFLKFNTGLNNAQIAEILNMKPETVKKQIYRILVQLRKQYGARLVELFCFITSYAKFSRTKILKTISSSFY